MDNWPAEAIHGVTAGRPATREERSRRIRRRNRFQRSAKRTRGSMGR